MVECSIGMSRRGSGGCIVVIVAVLLVELTFAPPPTPPLPPFLFLAQQCIYASGELRTCMPNMAFQCVS